MTWFYFIGTLPIIPLASKLEHNKDNRSSDKDSLKWHNSTNLDPPSTMSSMCWSREYSSKENPKWQISEYLTQHEKWLQSPSLTLDYMENNYAFLIMIVIYKTKSFSKSGLQPSRSRCRTWWYGESLQMKQRTSSWPWHYIHIDHQTTNVLIKWWQFAWTSWDSFQWHQAYLQLICWAWRGVHECS